MMKNRQLLVEGNDDLHVMYALCEKYKIPQTFEIKDCKGIDKLLDSISVRLKQSGIKTLGIIIDADTDLNTRWASIKSIFESFGYNMPQVIPQDGLILQEGDLPIVGVWLMPNNNSIGMLEDFIKFLIPQDDVLFSEVESSLEIIESKGVNKYKPVHKSKAFIHTWLSWQKDPGTPMGLSITKRYLDSDVKECQVFVDWINKLFN